MGWSMNMSIGWPNKAKAIAPPMPNLSLYITPNQFIDIPANTGGSDSDFTIEWFAQMSSDDNHPRAWSIGNFYDVGGAKAAVSIESGFMYFWIDGNIILNANISGIPYIGNWTWFMIQRFQGKICMYVNGDVVAAQQCGLSITSNGLPLYIASEGVESLQNGLMSNFRWTVGRTSYIPPGGDHYLIPDHSLVVDSPYTKLLIFQGYDLISEITDQSEFGNTIVNGTGVYDDHNPFGDAGSVLFGTI